MKRKMGIGKKRWSAQLIDWLTSKEKAGEEEGMVQKVYEGSEDSFFEEASQSLRQTLRRNQDNAEYKRDLKRYGTRIKLIDVAATSRRDKALPPLKKPQKPKRFETDYGKDLKRFGTRPGVIDVANDDPARRKKVKPFPLEFTKQMQAILQKKYPVAKVERGSQNPFSDIYRNFPKTQLTIRNLSSSETEVQLWGSSVLTNGEPVGPADVQHHAISTQLSAGTGIHPQGICFNPANNYVYVANQLSGTISVFNSSHALVKVINLEPGFPGMSSPVALAVNSIAPAQRYGYVYVACSVANKVAVIDLALNVAAYVSTGVRPVAIAFNAFNGNVYTVNLASDNVTVIDGGTFAEVAGSPLAAGSDPIGVGIYPVNGDIYIANSLANTITVYSAAHALQSTINAVGQFPVSISYNPANTTMYAVAGNSNAVYRINPATYAVAGSIATGQKPYNSFFNSYNNFLYVQNRQDNTLTVIRPDNTKIDGLSFGEQNIGGAFNPFNHCIYISDTANNVINVIGYTSSTSPVSVTGDYSEMNADFKANPCIIQHVKFVVTGAERLNGFRLTRSTATGVQSGKAISFELYASPQSAMNVAEVFELCGTIIDGSMNWRFMLPGLHTVSILIWFKQFQVVQILNPQS